MQDSPENKNDSVYADYLRFSAENNLISYTEFDTHTLNDLKLFDVPSEKHLGNIEEALDRIIRALPAIKRIFSRPVIRLRDKDEILPIETVKIINNHSLKHASFHSELWDDIDEECGIRPKKLLTIEHIETYTLYENLVFVYTVDGILSFVKRALSLFKDILYGCQDMHFNLLDRTHHNSYFLAIGKLHIEYARAQNDHVSVWSRCIEKLLFIDRTLRSKLKAPVYQKCKKSVKDKITLKKTNIFRCHRDYAQVYNFAKWFESNKKKMGDSSYKDSADNKEYSAFCTLLSVFAIGHFNFEFAESEKFDFDNLDVQADFLDWHLNVRRESMEKADILLFDITKDHTYRACLFLCEKESIPQSELDRLNARICADEHLFVSPRLHGEVETLYLSIFDVDSFRRIQQVLLRAMIYSDTSHKLCPFCGHELTENEGAYECTVCMAHISEKTCPRTNGKYYVSDIMKRSLISSRLESRKFLHDRYDEAQLHFRNITEITPSGKPICPKCRKEH